MAAIKSPIGISKKISNTSLVPMLLNVPTYALIKTGAKIASTSASTVVICPGSVPSQATVKTVSKIVSTSELDLAGTGTTSVSFGYAH